MGRHIGHDEIGIRFGHLSANAFPERDDRVVGRSAHIRPEVQSFGVVVGEIKAYPIVISHAVGKELAEVFEFLVCAFVLVGKQGNHAGFEAVEIHNFNFLQKYALRAKEFYINLLKKSVKGYLLQFRPFLLFLLRFFATYLLLTFIYQSYLGQFEAKKMEVDQITEIVAKQSQKTLSVFGSGVYTAPNPDEPGIKLFYQNCWVARIIEGCNGISVMILFVAFVVAFSGKLKQTVFFILAGVLMIHIFNIFRIALLAMAIFHYPQYEHILHGVLFPLVIYGLVFLLWVIWVNKFSLYAAKKK